MNLIDYLGRNAKNFPSRPACRAGERTWTYAQLEDMATRTGHGLEAFGVEHETPCAVISRNHVMGFTALLGILKARGAWVPLNIGNAEEDHLYILEHFDVRVLCFQREFEDFARRVREQVPTVNHFVCVDGISEIAPDMTEWMALQPNDDFHLPWEPDGMCMLRGTGGTTGKPKGVMNTNRNFEVTIANYMAQMRFDKPPVYLAAAPLSHAAVFAFVNMAMGGTMVILPKFEPQKVLETIEAEQVSFIYLPPTAVYGLLSQPAVGDHDYSSHRGRGLRGRARLLLHLRPQEGNDHHRRLQRVPAGSGAGHPRPPGRAGLRGSGRARREVGRGDQGCGRTEGRRESGRRGIDRRLPREAGRCEDAEVRRIRADTAAQFGRQSDAPRSARQVLGGP